MTEQECGTPIGLEPEVGADDGDKGQSFAHRVGRVGAMVGDGVV